MVTNGATGVTNQPEPQSSKRGIRRSLPTGLQPGCVWHAFRWRSRWNTRPLLWHSLLGSYVQAEARAVLSRCPHAVPAHTHGRWVRLSEFAFMNFLEYLQE